jgi:hypothetical protein
MAYLLRFNLDLEDTSDLLVGTLQLLQDDKEVNAYIATSSLRGRQGDHDWEQRGGVLPPNELLGVGKFYKVATTPLYMPDIKGVQGNFFPITPFEVETDGATRGDFGIHFDANVPGSLGCVVCPTKMGWRAFQRDMAMLLAQGIKQVDLDTNYS